MSKEAIRLEPKNDELLRNHADILAAFGENLKDENIINEALTLYKNAIQLNPINKTTKDNYNVTLARFAALKRDEKQFSESIILLKDQFTDAENRDYNLACLYALSNDLINSKELILRAEELNTLPKNPFKHLSNDTDLDSIKNKQWFLELLERLKEKEETINKAS